MRLTPETNTVAIQLPISKIDCPRSGWSMRRMIIDNSNKKLKKYFAGRKILIAKEITKIYEEIIRGTLSSLLEILETKTYKGECVLLVSKDDKNIYFD